MLINRKTKPAATRLKVKGERTRQAILETAVDIASVEGLEGLTIGQLATKLSMSKSGLFAHFGSKEDLQLATVDAARSIFIRAVIRPTFEAERGLSRLWKLCDIWLAYVGGGVFRGGCFFAAAAAEFDSRPGPVRDRIAAIMKEWLATLGRVVADAQHDGQFDRSVDPAQLAFEINALELAANWAFQLYGDKQAFARARAATLERLHRHATPSGAAVLPPLKKKRAKRKGLSAKDNELKAKRARGAKGVERPSFNLRARQKAT
ncbi:MAG TPA: TetR/AcrR family transcriptional regulator [Pyrinomonadaceae bacterium]|nr:TetR/AcrR family transcriptional regulator [Pyrinomonadaceae bacterium]